MIILIWGPFVHGDQMWWGPFVHWDQLSWGSIDLGDLMDWDHLSIGTKWLWGPSVSGTKCVTAIIVDFKFSPCFQKWSNTTTLSHQNFPKRNQNQSQTCSWTLLKVIIPSHPRQFHYFHQGKVKSSEDPHPVNACWNDQNGDHHKHPQIHRPDKLACPCHRILETQYWFASLKLFPSSIIFK